MDVRLSMLTGHYLIQKCNIWFRIYIFMLTNGVIMCTIERCSVGNVGFDQFKNAIKVFSYYFTNA